LEKDNILMVSDYKTTKNKKYLKDNLQLLTYAYVILSEDPDIEKIKASYVLLRHNFENITHEFLRDEILTVPDIYLKYTDMNTDIK
jgi:hypothetical protein